MALARAGEIPYAALAGLLVRRRPDFEALRSSLIAQARRRLRRRDPRGHLPAAYGLVTPAEVDPAIAERAARAIARLKDVDLAERPRAANAYYALLGHPAAFDALLAHGHAQIGKSHAETASWFDVAQVALAQLRCSEPPAPILAERTLRLAAHRANLDRVRGDLVAAAVAFEELKSDWRWREVLNLATQAELWSLRGSLARARRDFANAERCFEVAEAAYRAIPALTGVARTLLKRSGCTESQGNSGEALALAAEAGSLVEPEQNPEIYWSAHLNQANALVGLGRAQDASRVLELAKPYFRFGSDESHRMRLAWVEGRIHRALGRPEKAEARLRAAVDACDTLGLHYDGALARLDLADLLHAQKRHEEVKALSKTLIEAFRARAVDREALAAVKLFAEAAREERVRPMFLDALRAYLRLAQLDPSYPFHPPVATHVWFAAKVPEGRP